MLDIVQVMRRPQGGNNYSMEGLFAAIRGAAPPDVAIKAVTAPYPSRGMARRIGNMTWASRLPRRGVVHITGDILYVAATLGPRTVITVHDVGWVRMQWLAQAVYDLLWLRIPAHRARVVTTVSAFTREQLLQRISCPPEKVRVVPNCHDPAFRAAPPRPRPDRPTVLAVGTTANKNIERLCAALEGISCELHVIGPLYPEQRAAIERHRVAYRNSVALSLSELVRAYEDADTVAFPSTYEGFGLPIIEAQAVGRPVVTSSLASMPEVAGAGACFVDPFDVASIRAGLVRVLESEAYRAELRERGFENVRRFTAPAVAEQYASIYREVGAPA